jgi:hypothetical protein
MKKGDEPMSGSIEETFILDPKHEAFVAGKTDRLPGPSKTPLVLVLLFFGALELVYLYVAAKTWQEWYHLKHHGAYVEAQVIDLSEREDTDSDGNRTLNHYVTYRFVPEMGERPYEREQSIDKREWSRLQVGAEIPVYYSVLQPEINRLRPTSMGWVIAFGALPVGWGGLMLWIYIVMRRKLRKHARLAQHGRLLQGKVLRCSGRTHHSEDSSGDSTSTYTVTLEYELVSPEGKRLTGTSETTRNDLRSASLPAPGTSVAVLYADDQTHEAL